MTLKGWRVVKPQHNQSVQTDRDDIMSKTCVLKEEQIIKPEKIPHIGRIFPGLAELLLTRTSATTAGNKTFRPQDVSPLVVSPLVVSPPFWSPSRFAPQP